MKNIPSNMNRRNKFWAVVNTDGSIAQDDGGPIILASRRAARVLRKATNKANQDRTRVLRVEVSPKFAD